MMENVVAVAKDVYIWAVELVGMKGRRKVAWMVFQQD